MTIYNFGNGPFGMGTPITVPAPLGKPLETREGVRNGSRKINPITLDFETSPVTSRVVGMNNSQHLVQQCLSTEAGSAAMQALGNGFSKLTRITGSYVKEADTVVRAALSILTDENVIVIDSIEPRRIAGRPAGVFIRVKWTDVATGEQFTTDTT